MKLTLIVHLAIILAIAAIDFAFIVRFSELAYAAWDRMELREFKSQFRENAFLGLDEKALAAIFGAEIDGAALYSDDQRAAYWWPGMDAKSRPPLNLASGQFVTVKVFADGDKSVFVWLAKDSNDVWRVIGDITPPEDVVFGNGLQWRGSSGGARCFEEF